VSARQRTTRGKLGLASATSTSTDAADYQRCASRGERERLVQLAGLGALALCPTPLPSSRAVPVEHPLAANVAFQSVGRAERREIIDRRR